MEGPSVPPEMEGPSRNGGTEGRRDGEMKGRMDGRRDEEESTHVGAEGRVCWRGG